MKGKRKSKSIAKKKKKTYNYPKDNSLNREKDLEDSSYDKKQRIKTKSRKGKKNSRKDKTNIIKTKEPIKSYKEKNLKLKIVKEESNKKKNSLSEENINKSLYEEDYIVLINKTIEDYSSDDSIDSGDDSDKDLSTKEKKIKKIRKTAINEDLSLISLKKINNCNTKEEKDTVDIINHTIFSKDLEDNIKFDGKIFKLMKNKNKENEEIIYKCIYNRKDEANRQKLHLGAFCNATLKAKIGVRLNTKGYIISITKNHSHECLSLIKSNVINNNETINQFIDFKNKVFSMLNDINIYDRKDCKNKIQAIYNNKYDFQLKKSTINNIIQKWKNNSIKFTKYQCIENPYDNEKELYLREHHVKYIFIENKENIIPIEYFIWANDVNIAHIRKSKNIFFDATFHVPYGFSQCLILLYKDIITGEKYPGIYTVMNKKNYIIYKLVLESINNILTQDKLYNLEIETITTDAEAALLKAIKIIL